MIMTLFDDDLFLWVVLIFGIGLYLIKTYEVLIDVLKWITLLIFVLSTLIIVIFYLYKKSKFARSKTGDKRVKSAKPKERASNSAIIAEPRKELLQIADSRKTEEKPKIAAIPKRKEVTITLDSDKGFFRFKELKLEEVKYLLAKGYKIGKHKSLSSDKIEKFLLKPRFNESERHFFVVYDIANFLEKNDVMVSLFTTKKPDLVFELNSRKFAIEVETGKNRFKKERLKEKVSLLKSYDSWFFVITNRNCSKEYRKFGKVVELRRLRNFLLKLLKNDTEKLLTNLKSIVGK